jgi:hypothetical protein
LYKLYLVSSDASFDRGRGRRRSRRLRDLKERSRPVEAVYSGYSCRFGHRPSGDEPGIDRTSVRVVVVVIDAIRAVGLGWLSGQKSGLVPDKRG